MPYEFVDEPQGRYEFVDEPPNKPGIRGEGYAEAMDYTGRNQRAAVARGLGSLGATLLTPYDMAMSNTQSIGNPERRAAMDEGAQAMGGDLASPEFQTVKLATEVGTTWPIGGAAAKLIGKIPGASAALPNLLPAIQSGGMTTGGATGLYGAANRVAGGSVLGALTAGALNPQDTGTGMLIGGGFPLATQVAGKGGEMVGKLFKSNKPSWATPTKLQTAKESMDAGYVIPPSMIDPTLKNRAMESFSGKHATAQVAATRNQAVTERLARQALGLADDVPLSFATMAKYRADQHAAGYEPLRQVGLIPAGQKFNQALDDIANKYKGKGTIPAIADSKQEILDLVDSYRSKGFDAGDAVDAIRTLREDATSLFRSANAGDKAKAKATKAIADAFEGAIDDALAMQGKRDLLKAYRDARQNIAKSGTVEKAIREGSGTLDARIIARELQKGKPLTGELKTIAQFGNTFDKAAQPPHLIGSPDVGNLRSFLSAGSAGAGGYAGSVLGPAGSAAGAAIGAAYPFVVPPLVRARMFSEGAQRGLLPSATGAGLLSQGADELLPFMYRSNPALMSGLIDQ